MDGKNGSRAVAERNGGEKRVRENVARFVSVRGCSLKWFWGGAQWKFLERKKSSRLRGNPKFPSLAVCMTRMTIKEFFKNDRYAALSGIELLEAEPGRARARMEVRDMHLNAGNVAQGGAIFTLADFAFAAAVNARGNMAVSVETSIRFFKGVGAGTLFAEARVVNAHAKLETYEARVTNEKDELVALFTATAYRKDARLPFAQGK